MIPTVAQCLRLMDQYGMLPNIREHSLMVGRVAGFIGQSLVRAGRNLSLELIVSGALLHDIAKTASLSLKTEMRHAQMGREICLKHGFDELAEIVAEHVVLKEGVPEQRCAEKEIVYYADKRVLHDAIVTLQARLDYIIKRYGKGDERLHAIIRENFVQAQAIEELLFAELDFPPEELEDRLHEELSRSEALQ